MEKSSQIAWKIAPLRHFFPLKVVPLIEVLLYCAIQSGIFELDFKIKSSDFAGSGQKFGIQSNFDKRERKNMRKVPVYRIIPLDVVHSACGMESERIESLPLTGFLPLKAVPLNEVLL
jgi:hypothetical protein